jgi:arginase
MQTEIITREIAVLGIPLDWNSSYKKGPAAAPGKIRQALFSRSTNLWTEKGIDLADGNGWQDAGDLLFNDEGTAFAEIENAINELLKKDVRIVSLGGDHSITYPIIRAYGKKYNNLTILQLDAHPDLYDNLEGNRFSHACPFARIMEEKLAVRLVQAGIRTMNGLQREQAERFSVETIDMINKDRIPEITFEGPIYLTLDMDCLDPAFAPGVSHYEPGGLSTREVLSIIQDLKGRLVGADIVEYNPKRDPQGISAMTAAKLLKEIIGRIMED